MLTPMKQRTYNKAPLYSLNLLADNGKRVVVNNGTITDLEIDLDLVEVFNHAHPTTFVNSPVDTFTVFK